MVLLGSELVTGAISAVGCSKRHFFQIPWQYSLKKLHLEKGAHAQIAGKNLQVRSQTWRESERSLAVIIIIINCNSRQQQWCSVNGTSLSICYCFAGNWHQACD